MADYRKGLHLIPEHMHNAVSIWVERAEPHPSMLGSFFAAVLTNDLMGAAAHADEENVRALKSWAIFFYNFILGIRFGSEFTL